ncbi:MAG TPA: UDP-N-acetylmuramoyl-L-alanine--D-glutamate ligase [Desulfobacteraceae bacterium]|nr:UDP-N-acetylmuramoyl-L-alanine--D-glutamate ligase [Desulfobacteraceae bacterium]
MRLEKGQRCVVIGLGASGMAAVRFLHGQGVQVSVSEARPPDRIDPHDLEELRQLGAELETGGHSGRFFRDAELIVPSPGVPLDLPVIAAARRRGVAVAGELALAAGRIDAPVIAVTGSNGKTTVTSLIGHLLRTAGREVFVGGNIGTPVLEYIQSGRKAETVVLELSSFQLELSGSFRPAVALLLNITPDHLDRHGSMAAYAAAKKRIYANQGIHDTAIVGADDPLVMAGEAPGAGTVLRFGFNPVSEARVIDAGVALTGMIGGVKVEEWYGLETTALGSDINRLNAAAAILAARTRGCSAEDIRPGLASFAPPAHRMTQVAEIDGVRYVDDSKGTNIGAVAAALAASGDRVILIAGGRNKGGDFDLLAPAVSRHVLHLVLIGEAAGPMAEQLGGLAPATMAASMEDAVHRAAELARPGDTVLLSPGCASFDMFTGYAQRGEVFQRAVLALRDIRQTCA